MINNLYLVSYLPLILGLALISLTRLNLKIYQGLFLVFIAFLVMMSSMYDSRISVTGVILAAAFGEVLHLITIAVIGKGLKISNYAAILYAFGLFPWWLNALDSFVYVVLIFLFTTVGSTIQILMAGRPFGLKTINPAVAARKLSENDFILFRKKAGVIFSIYFLFAAITTLVLSLLS